VRTATPSSYAIADVPESTVTVRVGTTPNDSNAEAFYAQEMGFFRQAGLNVELTSFNNGASAAAAMASSSIDISISPPMQIAQAISHGLPFIVIAAGALNTIRAPAAWIVVAKNSPIKSAKDLIGKTIAVNGLNSSSENPLDAWLVKNGAVTSESHRIEMPSSVMSAALARGTIDAAVIFEPALSEGLRRGEIRVLAVPTGAMRNVYLQTAWFTTKQFATQNPQAVRRFARAIYLAAEWANTHQKQSGEILAAHSKLDLALVDSMQRVQYARSLQASEIAPELETGFTFGRLQRPVAAAELIGP
jgi:NitT/TauT family transport system substrate-binding protein